MQDKLKNAKSGIEIGVGLIPNRDNYGIYVQRDGIRKFYGRCATRKMALEFIDILREWDEAGGGDDTVHESH
jgi:hypothetical protein